MQPLFINGLVFGWVSYTQAPPYGRRAVFVFTYPVLRPFIFTSMRCRSRRSRRSNIQSRQRLIRVVIVFMGSKGLKV